MSQIISENKDSKLILKIEGEFTEKDLINEFNKLTLDYLQESSTKGIIPKIIIDLEKITLTRAVGLGAMLLAYRKVMPLQGAVMLANLKKGQVKTLIDLTRLNQVLTVCSMKEALLK